MAKKIPIRTSISLALISFGGNLAWAVENQYYNVFLFNNIIGDTFYVSLMVAITAVVSTGTTIMMGALSDIKGKRRPFILYSFFFWAITTALFPYAAFLQPVMLAVAMAIFIDCVMSFFGATIYDACYNAHIADITTLENRGRAVSINEIMTLFATLVVYAAAGPIIEIFGNYVFYISIGIFTGIIGLVGAFLMKDSPDLKPQEGTVWGHIRTTFQFKTLRENKDAFLVLTSIAIWAIGFNIFFSFIVIYLEHYLSFGLWNASLIMFGALFSSVLLGIPIGILVDKIGRKKVSIISLVGCSIGLILFGLSENIVMVIITGIIWVAFMTGWRIANATWIKDLFPRDKLAQFNGFFLISNVLIGMVIGSPIGGLIGREFGQSITVEGQEKIVPSPLIYFIGAIVVLLAIIPLFKAKERRDISP